MTTIDKLYEILLSENIIGSVGRITFNLKDVSVGIRDVSVVGNIIQEWLEHFMDKHNVHYRKKTNTQEFPDFLLSETDEDIEDLLEVKAFTKSPNFDIANFASYARSIKEHPYRLDAKYLIFKYSLIEDGIIINDIWLKSVWEICSASERSHVKIQWKQGHPVNIRPATWYSERSEFKTFSTRKDFVESLNKVIGMAGLDSSIQKKWLPTVMERYKELTARDL